MKRVRTARSTPRKYEPEAFDALAGRYEAEQQAGFIMTLTHEGEGFYVQLTGQPKVEITPTSDSTFAVQGVEASLTFHRGTDGNVGSLTLQQAGRQLLFQRLKEEPWAPSEADRAAFAGHYFSEELQTFYTVAEKDSGLVVKHRRMENLPLTPTTEDTFSGEFPIFSVEFPIGELVFTRDEAGHVTGLSVSNGRTRGVRFEKWDN
ncbi:MAG: DUF3471 domain-containing protein [Balneolaceae bacterium]|nr:DUF3471 domain-containing protein [Balneolaceae bacterium]